MSENAIPRNASWNAPNTVLSISQESHTSPLRPIVVQEHEDSDSIGGVTGSPHLYLMFSSSNAYYATVENENVSNPGLSATFYLYDSTRMRRVVRFDIPFWRWRLVLIWMRSACHIKYWRDTSIMIFANLEI